MTICHENNEFSLKLMHCIRNSTFLFKKQIKTNFLSYYSYNTSVERDISMRIVINEYDYKFHSLKTGFHFHWIYNYFNGRMYHFIWISQLLPYYGLFRAQTVVRMFGWKIMNLHILFGLLKIKLTVHLGPNRETFYVLPR